MTFAITHAGVVHTLHKHFKNQMLLGVRRLIACGVGTSFSQWNLCLVAHFFYLIFFSVIIARHQKDLAEPPVFSSFFPFLTRDATAVDNVTSAGRFCLLGYFCEISPEHLGTRYLQGLFLQSTSVDACRGGWYDLTDLSPPDWWRQAAINQSINQSLCFSSAKSQPMASRSTLYNHRRKDRIGMKK